MKIAVIGAGSWGTALANQLAGNGHNVSLWARRTEVVTSINKEHRNPRYLSDVRLRDDVVATLSHRDAVLRARAAVIVTPSNLLRGVARALADCVDPDFPVIICSKGVEEGSGLLPNEVFEAEMGNGDRIAVLSGPNHAEEVIRGIPSGTVIASTSADTAHFFRDAFASKAFRAYTSEDIIGVELCAAFKNVIAIAVGLSYGIGFGDNTAAMLMTRGLAEMSRLMLFRGIPVFIDSRADLYAPEFSGKADDIFMDFINTSSIGTFYEDTFEKYGITHVITYENSKMNMIITKTNDPHYKELYKDDYFVVYERVTN